MIFIVLTRVVLAQEGERYLEPDFSARIIDVDAISLEGEKRAEVVGALATLAGAEGTDDLVRMKAMAIALRLDNMHAAARQVNDLLIAGGSIVPEGDGGGRLSEAIALLAETAATLRDEGIEEEDAVIFPYLMDIVAGARGESASADGMALPGRLRWELVLEGVGGPGKEMDPPGAASPDPEDKSSGADPKSDGQGRPETREAVDVMTIPEMPPAKSVAAEKGKPASAKEPTAWKFKARTAALRIVVFEDPDEGGGAIPCRISVTVADEERGDKGTPYYSSGGISPRAAEQLAVAARVLKQRHAFGPENHRIGIELTSLEDGRTLPFADSRLGVPVLFLLDALVTGATLDDSISVGGTLATPSGGTAPRGRWGAIVAAAGRGGANAVIVSPSAEADLTDSIIAGDLDPLLSVQAIELAKADEVGAFLTGSRDANVHEAMRLFGEVQDLTGRHDVKDLMANLKVQERFTEVVNLMPNHLSAKLLLAYGRGTLPQRMSLRGSLRQINETIEPVRGLGETTNTVVVTTSQDDLCADSLFGLRRLRTNMAEGSLAYCDAAVDFVELLREYLKLSNRTTSGAMQQGAELKAARSRMEALRSGFEAALETP